MLQSLIRSFVSLGEGRSNLIKEILKCALFQAGRFLILAEVPGSRDSLFYLAPISNSIPYDLVYAGFF